MRVGGEKREIGGREQRFITSEVGQEFTLSPPISKEK
jgi:hypothetical protein